VVNLINSPTGRALRSIHDSEIAARVLGVNVARYKLLAFVMSAIFTSIAGSYFALLDGFVTPNTASFLLSIELVVMAVLGGLGSILGSIVGAAILVILPQALTVFHEYEQVALGAIIVVFLIFLPRGIVPAAAGLFRRGDA
jgi:branched-chain amino acid transport system permease protein